MPANLAMCVAWKGSHRIEKLKTNVPHMTVNCLARLFE